MEVIDRAMATADLELVGRSDRAGYPCLGIANGGFQIAAKSEARGNRRRQRTSGAMGVLRCDTGGRQRDDVAAAHQIIDAFGATTVAALDQHRASAHREQTFALAL